MNESADSNASADHETADRSASFVQSEETKIESIFYGLRWAHFGPTIADYFWEGIVTLMEQGDSLPPAIREWLDTQEELLRDDPPDWLTDWAQELVNEKLEEISQAIDSAADCFVSNQLHDSISNGLQNAMDEIATGVYDSVGYDLRDAASGLVRDVEYDNL